MATVRITQDVKNTIHDAAKNLFAKRLEQAEAFFMDEDTLARKVVDHWVDKSGFALAWRSIPADVMYTSETVYIATINGRVRDKEVSASAPLTQPLADGAVAWSYHIESEDFKGISIAWGNWLEEKTRLKAQSAAFVSKVDTFLKRHATLKAALAEWPQLWEIVPDTLRAKHNTVSACPAPLPPAAGDGFDTSALTGAIVTSKMVNATIAGA